MPGGKRIKIIIDGREVETEAGTLLIKAAEDAGIYIPRLCYHEGLRPDGNCRMCLVEIEGLRKPVPSCMTPVREGMVVRTNTPALQEHRKKVLEFILTSHPMDCPICDQAGECVLQDYYFTYDLEDRRYLEDRERKPKRVHWGKNLIYDAERCILCRRCVRFLEDVTKTRELGVFERGIHSYIGLFDGRKIENNYSGNLVDICPVGAITDLDFRFKMRVWFLDRTPSICPFCGRGCNIEIHTNTDRLRNRFSSQRVFRIKPRKRPDVNGWWICDEGRYSYKFIDEGRILHPLSNGRKITWEAAGKKLREIIGKEVRVYLSAWMSNEELIYWKRLAELLQWKVSLVKRPDGDEDKLLRVKDKNPNTTGSKILGIKEERGNEEVSVVFHFPEFAPEHRIKIGIFTNEFPDMERWELILPAAVFAEKEGHWTNFQGKLQKFQKALEPLGEAREEGKIGEFFAGAFGIELPWERQEMEREFLKEYKKWSGS